MAKAKKKKTAAEEALEEYLAIQLTPEQKAANYAAAVKACERAAAKGVYERALELRGKVKWSMTWQELRGAGH